MSRTNLIPVAQIRGTDPQGGFIQRELPVLLKGECREWPAFAKWTPDFFRKTYGDIQVPMSNYKKNPYQPQTQKSSMRISDYLDSALRIASGGRGSDEDLYSAGWFFCNGHCELLKDITVPSYFAENWADRVQKVIHFDTRSILFGHPKVESPLHTDSFFVSTYFAMLKGQKRMRLVAPEHSAHVRNGFDVFDDARVRELADKGVPVYDAVVEEGDVAWFPPGWWHHVKNDTFTISMTTSFVSSFHFLPFEQQVRATLIKPLLRLAQVKDEVMAGAFPGETLHHSEKALDNAYFVRNETQYVEFFNRELAKTGRILRHLQDRVEA
jgi:hypothetical protein